MEKSIHFRLNMELLYENLIKKGVPAFLSEQNMVNCLSEIVLYSEKAEFGLNKLFLSTPELLHKYPCKRKNTRFIILGCKEDLPADIDFIYILVDESYGAIQLYNILQEIFSRYHKLEQDLMDIIINDGDMDDICDLISQYYGSGVFLHDEHYRVLARSKKSKYPLPDLDFDEDSYYPVLNRALIDSLKISEAFQQTMDTKGAHFWDSDFDDRHTIFTNLWSDEILIGRLLVHVPDQNLDPGELSVLSFFGAILELIYSYNQNTANFSSPGPARLIINAIDGKPASPAECSKALSVLSWNPDDFLLCCCASYQHNTITFMSVHSICVSIKKLIPRCYTLYHENKIYVLINLTQCSMDVGDVQMRLSDIIREGLLHMGVSYRFQNLTRLCDYLKQAQTALDYIHQEEVPRWFCSFREYALQHWLTYGIYDFEEDSIIPKILQDLLAYDEANGTDLYNTLFVYLDNERNQTLASRILKINRSTLLNRIDKINTLFSGIKRLDESPERLMLLMGMYYLKLNKK